MTRFDDGYDLEDDDYEDEMEDDQDAELETFRILSAVGHARLFQTNEDDEIAMANLLYIGQYIQMLEAKVDSLDGRLTLALTP
ncbi:MAG: hypothetical protein KUG81_07390 [Gammaproteobacteria bacterium]|nr:hypothetical protein [Gammaproteobacteria bacterium]